jgi:hypothetical protein
MRRMFIQLAVVILVASSTFVGFVPTASAVACPTVGAAPIFAVTPAPSPGVNWSGCNLNNANLSANLSGANLSNASLVGASLVGANLTGADLSGADLTNASLVGTNLTGANLTGVDLSGVTVDPGTDLETAFVTCSDTGILGTGLSGLGPPDLPTGWTVTGGGTTLSVPISSCSATTSSAPVMITLTIDFIAQEATCKGGNPSGVQGTWVTLPGADQCSQTGPRANANAVLLGWATSSSFPVALARSQVAKAWGVIDDTFNGVRMIFIPAGMSTFMFSDNRLFPIWSA